MSDTQKVWPTLLLAALVVISIIVSYVLYANSTKVDLTGLATSSEVSALKTEFSNLKTQIAALNKSTETTTAVSDDSYTLSKEEFEDQAVEAKALELATESVNSKDFKKAVYALLVNSNNTVYDLDIESYKDITEVKIKEADVDEDEVEFEVVVYYFDDDDEDNTMKAYLENFVVSVDDLDFDEEFEDAEVDEDYMSDLVISKVMEK